jgi:hypothetical protein
MTDDRTEQEVEQDVYDSRLMHGDNYTDPNDIAIVARLKELSPRMFQICLMFTCQDELSVEQQLALLDDAAGEAEGVGRSLGPNSWTPPDGMDVFCARLQQATANRLARAERRGAARKDEPLDKIVAELKREKKVELLEQLEQFAAKLRSELDDDTRFGICPTCKQHGRLYNIASEPGRAGKYHWVACDAHRVCWHVGYNLFSSYQFETAETWAANEKILSDYAVIQLKDAH